MRANARALPAAHSSISHNPQSGRQVSAGTGAGALVAAAAPAMRGLLDTAVPWKAAALGCIHSAATGTRNAGKAAERKGSARIAPNADVHTRCLSAAERARKTQAT